MIRSIECRSNCAQKYLWLFWHGRLKTGKPFGDPKSCEQRHQHTFPETTDGLFSLPSNDGVLTQGTLAPLLLELEKPNKTAGILGAWVAQLPLFRPVLIKKHMSTSSTTRKLIQDNTPWDTYSTIILLILFTSLVNLITPDNGKSEVTSIQN